MVRVKPFKAIRPKKELADKVAALPYDVVNTKEAKELAQGNPYSYYHIDKAEIDLPEQISPYDREVYQAATRNLAHFIENGWLFKEEKALYYLYELTMDGKSQTGIVATTAIEDYVQGKIKKHEFTRPEKELDRINHMQACDANTSPIFLTYRFEEKIQHIIKEWKTSKDPEYSFTSYHDVKHRVWIVDGSKKIEELERLFEEVPALYIADGHHRTESAAKVGLKKREENQQSKESEYFLSVIFPENELSIWEYNRVIRESIPEDFFEQLSTNFEIEESDVKKAQETGQIQMYIEKQWYTLKIKPERIPKERVGKLDVSLLQKYVCEEVFSINDIRTDKRIDFVGGIRGPKELEQLVDSGEWTIAFSMYPTSIHDLLDVADAGEIMPPKSTWFEPKLLSGLFLHDLETR
jgi:uncharacterized protein (DUF1015 family)